MIEIWPAIDLIESESVRLTEGDYATKEAMTKTAEESIAFYNQFACVKRIHIVDLIGAKTSQPVERSFITTLVQQAQKPVEVGGGIREIETVQAYFEAGVSYCIVGTKAIEDFEWLQALTERYPNRIYLGLDAYDDEIKVNGWLESSRYQLSTFIDKVDALKLGGIIYTDISKDGRMQGPNVARVKDLVEQSAHPIIASGGVRHQSDLKALEKVGAKAAIVGKAAHQASFWEGLT
ncbi:1-(5-phosphoribosyl)-5-((5-phosphoribosylamino)methylideneamino)imidazole-4-carboxamide isomerase [Staphylococcus massiliensis]|uniref:1-(5-phosphoribosyl)-5-[(5-phosphoribosylamino)methylideneamino] imidazole-4-carboxamide isomerase n=1 Tax=Staphylococcus massiliensis S46 TaxID=1229783 RepID=K9AT01_9STAP|nr:1-(5-phosphoribosyl)-5-((5-phosphoribosylamino)methylideneamino)imidazole-4-carboxamide isomerase [Staphylococcus massiliensis]EKU50528.1 1-(5-phosphoribosyl)-5-[(5-phosphoribosylamino)methylideneamino] imidazole-4-carboxamide isomerase [Staphylococcus massiliensis S46]MCG3398701.1 1-(5-phosphoribosyl)-5-((5-phosphoribosylamino)methylideneamino)imidazole-4-carboxamide isomerase [Staphylococcus massiliensis]MCG3401262.1 1-(5-phosphoribosyl)-5-((5-phosphoribosylamino)methylideneamino)imidazole-